MNSLIQTFGQTTRKQILTSPQRAGAMLRYAYLLMAAKSRYAPSRDFLPAREYLLSACNRSVARSLQAQPNAGIVNVFLPCEILHAMGVHPMFPEGMAVYFSAAASERAFIETAEKNGVPDSFCSYHKVLIGAAESGVLPKPRFILHTTLLCDANRLTFKRLADYYTIPRYCVDVPNHAGPQSVGYVADQLRGMAAFLSQHSGLTLDEDTLKQTLERTRSTITLYRRYLRLRRERALPADMTGEMLPLFSNHVLLGTEDALQYARRLVTDMEALPTGKSKVRLVWVHTMPNWQEPLRALFRRHPEVELLGCDLAFSALQPTDPEKPYESMAKRILENHLNGPASRRIDAVLAFAREMRADGVVYFNHWGCKATMGASQLARKKLEESGFPTLVFDGDGCDSGNAGSGQMLTRMEAFLEQLEAGV
ncbi:2-hydroxyacyl-CoA dehydratase family protein [Ruminococcaceae bacterium OttesenSCG-928-I18]|nr:2-hydroxyacyl-CoA dehydratase family protein [Ruminococcaceae bacterium OttesenSCG-928-I18]